jgi:predicted nucleic acid-binding protein
MIQNHQLELMSSAVLEYENSKNSDLERAKAVNFWLSIATYRQTITETIRSRAKEIEMFGVKTIDALHVACTEASQSDYFLTCDKRLINHCKNLNLKVINPIEFIMEIDQAS